MAVTILIKHHVPRSFDLLYVRPEYEIEGKSRPERNDSPPHILGLPPTVKFLEVNTVALRDRDKQPLATWLFLKELFTIQCPPGWPIDQKYMAYLSYGTCYTDTDDGSWQQIVTCGNVLYPTGKQKRAAGEMYHEVLQLQAGSMPAMKEQFVELPLLRVWSTNSERKNGGRGVGPFPHCGGNSVPALLFCRTETNWIRSARVRELERDEPIPKIYHL